MRATTLSLIFFAIAGCSGGTTNPTPDASVSNDMSATGDMATGTPDMAVLVSGTKVVSGLVDVIGTTDDNFLIYNDLASGEVTVADFTGKNATTLGLFNDSGNTYPVGNTHNVVVVWHDGDGDNNGPLTIWTQANGKKDISQNAAGLPFMAPAPRWAVSADSKYFAYFDNVSPDVSGDLTVVQTDGTNAKVLSKAVSLDPTGCSAVVAFIAGKLVAAHCGTAGDGGTTGATITAYDPATGNGTDLATDMQTYLVSDVASTSVLTVTSGGVGQVYNVMTGVKSSASLANFVDGFFSADGTKVLYNTTNGAFDSIALDGTPPTVLQANNVTAWNTFSDDRKTITFSSDFDQQTMLADLYLAPADRPAVAMPLVMTNTGATGSYWGSGFTSDSSQALFFTNITLNTMDMSPQDGDLSLVSFGGSAQKVGSHVWYALAAGGTKIVYNDNYDPNPGVGDLEVLDISKGTTPTAIATRADQDFILSADKKTLVYSTSEDKTLQGLYVFSIP